MASKFKTYTITVTARYEVAAETAESALKSYHVTFDGIDPQTLGIAEREVIPAGYFEYLDGKVTAEERE